MNQKNDKNKEKREKNEKDCCFNLGHHYRRRSFGFWRVSYGTWYFKRYIKFWPKKGRIKNEKENYCGGFGSGYDACYAC